MRYRYTTLHSQRVRFVEGLTSPATVLGNQGLIVGAPEIDRGMVCDGADRYVSQVGDPASLKSWSVIADITPGSVVGALPLFEFASSVSNGLWLGQQNANPCVQVWWSDGTTTTLVDVAHALVVGTRVQIAVTYDGTTVRSYVNGDPGTTAAVANKICVGPVVRQAVVGESVVLSAGVYVGTIYDVRLWERALEAADLVAWSNA